MKTSAARPKSDKDQQRHLLVRLDAKNQELELLWRGIPHPEEPAEVKAARKLVDAYEDAQDKADAEQRNALNLLKQWLREQVLFRPAQEALNLVKTYELLNIGQALKAGLTMEDRNDQPILD